jgi:hypothetical protein
MGATPGGSSDVTIGSLAVPALNAGQSTSVSQTLTLPAVPPPALSGSTTFILSIVQDADYVTNQFYPHLATQGNGFDSAAVTIDSPSYMGNAPTSLPALAVTAVQTDSQNIKWGQNFQVATEIQNSGTADSGEFRVRYLLVGDNEATAPALFLADATLANVPAGNGEDFIQTIHLPTHLPPGQTLTSGIARIAVIIDPENTLYQKSTTGKAGFSNRINLQIVGQDGTTTTATPPSTTTSTQNNAVAKTAAQKAAAAKAARAAAAAARAAKPKPVNHSVGTILKRDLRIYPQRVIDYFKKHL